MSGVSKEKSPSRQEKGARPDGGGRSAHKDVRASKPEHANRVEFTTCHLKRPRSRSRRPTLPRKPRARTATGSLPRSSRRRSVGASTLSATRCVARSSPACGAPRSAITSRPRPWMRSRSSWARRRRNRTRPSVRVAPPRGPRALPLPKPRREDLQLLAVLGDGPPREANAVVLAELLDDLLVGVRPRAVLGVDDVLDDVLHAERRGEEGREGNDLSGREQHELPGGRAAYGGLVHPDALPHLRAGERTERLDALLEEVALALDDHVGDTGDGLTALVDVVDEELRSCDVLAEWLPFVVGHLRRLRTRAPRGLEVGDELSIDRIHA